MPPSLQLFVEMSLVTSFLHIHVSSPQQTRLPHAAFQDIELAVLHKCQYVIFAGVSKCVIKIPTELHSLPPRFIAPIFTEACWDFFFVPRNVNFLPHDVARQAAFCN